MQTQNLILASSSKIRKSILQNAGLKFKTRQPQFDETSAHQSLRAIPARAIAIFLAEQKALSLAAHRHLIMGADQTLSYQGNLYKKPNSIDQAHRQLLALRGGTHTLHSALAIAQDGRVIWTVCQEAQVTMRNFSDDFARTYIAACGTKLLNTVGSYQLESLGAQLFEKIEGDYFTILGLPLLPCLAFLRDIKFIAS